MIRMSRIQRALMIREVALGVIRTHGRKSTRYGWEGEHVEADLGELHMSHRNQTRWLTTSPVIKKLPRSDAMSEGYGAARILECGLDIWTPSRKVLNIEWSIDDQEVDLVSFRRGAWEDALLASAQDPRLGLGFVH